MTVNEKLQELRKSMKNVGVDAYIIPSTDPHISEYVADHWQARTWISGFDGSAGTVVVTHDHAGLWTDGRYFLQANEQLSDSEFELHKQGVPGAVDFPDWLNQKFSKASKIGFDSWVFPIALANKLKSKFELKGIEIVGDHDLIAEVWKNRIPLPNKEAFAQNVKYAGKSRKDKIDEIRQGLNKLGASKTLICSLDDIGWLLNIRGYDVAYNPVVISYVFISNEKTILFIDESKLNDSLKNDLVSSGIEIKNYDDIKHIDMEFNSDDLVLLDPLRANHKLFEMIHKKSRIVLSENISTGLKALKNETELSGIRNAMIRDCQSMAKFGVWLENNSTDELGAMKRLRECREEGDLFYGESFNTIAGYAGNGAIIHYGSNESTNKEIKDETFFLLDSGGQYYDGTTDITRMFHLGEASEQEKLDYTMVLKGMIQLSVQKFPENTRGSQLDILARQFLWNNGINYQHGTGHGVGCFMNVHEGPQNIRMDENATTLKPGMILSNEPGCYRAGKYGIRIENLVAVKEIEETEFGKYLGFETLTLFPIETKTIEKSIMTNEEINWLNDYHKMVYDRCSEGLEENVKTWLADKCKAI